MLGWKYRILLSMRLAPAGEGVLPPVKTEKLGRLW